MAGTIQFKKTSFFTQDSTDLPANTTITVSGSDSTHAPMYDSETSVATTDVNVRSYEVYIDKGSDSDNKTVSRIAKVAPIGTTDTTGYDLQLMSVSDLGSALSSFEIELTYLGTSTTDDLHVVFVCEAK